MRTGAKLKHARCLLAPQGLPHRGENCETGRDLTRFDARTCPLLEHRRVILPKGEVRPANEGVVGPQTTGYPGSDRVVDPNRGSFFWFGWVVERRSDSCGGWEHVLDRCFQQLRVQTARRIRCFQDFGVQTARRIQHQGPESQRSTFASLAIGIC